MSINYQVCYIFSKDLFYIKLYLFVSHYLPVFYSIVMYYIYSTLSCVVFHCPVLHSTAMCYIPLLCVVFHCHVLYYTAMCCFPLPCVAFHWHVLYSTVMCCIPLSCIVFHCYVLYSIARCFDCPLFPVTAVLYLTTLCFLLLLCCI